MPVDRRRTWLIAGVAALAILVLAVLLLGNRSGGTATSSPSPSVSASPSGSPSSSSGGSPSASAPTAGASATTAPASPSAATSSVPVTPTVTPTIVGRDASGDWAGTWQDTEPDTDRGALRLTLAQVGTTLEGTIDVDDNSCLVSGAVQGAVTGNAITLQVIRRDEVELVGTIDGNLMSGTFTMACNTTKGTWEVRRGG